MIVGGVTCLSDSGGVVPIAIFPNAPEGKVIRRDMGAPTCMDVVGMVAIRVKQVVRLKNFVVLVSTNFS